jgi:hypothetical protein
MRDLERRIVELENEGAPPDAPIFIWEGDPIPPGAEGRTMHIVRWLREGEQAPGADYGDS